MTTLQQDIRVSKIIRKEYFKLVSLSDCNWTRTQNHLVLKRTLNHLAKLVLGSSPVAVT